MTEGNDSEEPVSCSVRLASAFQRKDKVHVQYFLFQHHGSDLSCSAVGLYGYWSFLEQCKKPKLHPDLLASELLNHRMETSGRLEGRSLAATEEHPSYPQYLLMERLWELSTESVCLIWVELGALLQIHAVLVNLPVEGHTPEILPCFSCRSVVWKTCREGWMSVGLMLLRYDWFLYTLEWDKIPY